MTDEQINQRVAEVCGWTDFEKCSCGTKISAWPPFYSGHKKHVPNYCVDLNAMHEAEKALNDERWTLYAAFLFRLTVRPQTATARQRAEAFLRTLGKWEEVQG